SHYRFPRRGTTAKNRRSLHRIDTALAKKNLLLGLNFVGPVAEQLGNHGRRSTAGQRCNTSVASRIGPHGNMEVSGPWQHYAKIGRQHRVDGVLENVMRLHGALA